MKKLLLLTKTLLAAVLLCVGQNAWGASITYNFQSFISNALNASKDLEVGDASGVKCNSQTLNVLLDMNSTNYETRGDKTESQKSPYYLTFNGRFAASGDFQLNRASGYGIRTAKSNAYRYFAVLDLNAGDKITFNYENAEQVVFTFYSDNVTGKSVGDNVESGVEYTMSAAGHLDLQTTKNTGARLQSIVINYEVVSSPSVGTATNVNTTTGARTLPITAGVSDAENAVTTYWSATTELTPENYSSEGTEVEDNSITTTSDVVYLISVSSTGICSAGITSEASDWGITWNQTASVGLNSVTNHNGWLSSPVFTITGPEGHTSLAYTFTPDGGEESAKTNITSGSTYKPTGKGVLTVYANLTGYLPSSYSIPVSNIYNSSYSTDFTAYTESPFGANSKDVTSTWWTTAYRSTASSNATLGRFRFGNNTVTDLVIGYGIGRFDKNCMSNKIRYAVKGNIEVLTIKNNNSSGVTSASYYTNILETSGNGGQLELSAEFDVTKYHTVAQHHCCSPVTDAVLSAILDCESYETSNDFATAIEAESFSTAAEVYAFHSAWQIAKAKASGSTDYSKAIMNKTFELHNTNGWTIYGDPATGGADSDNNGIVEYGEGWSQYYTGWNGRNVSQNISTLPAGTYRLTAKVYSWDEGAPVRLFANGQLSDAENGSDHDPVLDFTVTGSEPSIKIGIGGTGHEDDTDNTWGTWGYRVKNFTLTKTGELATIGAKGYTTFSSSYPLNLGGISGGTAYKVIASDVDGTVVTPSAASGNIAAGEGLILSGTAGETVTIPVAASGDAISGNLMVGCPTGATINKATPNYEKFYVLVNGDTEAKFANLTDWVGADKSVNIPANKAYLYIPGLSARSMSIVLGDKVTGVANVEAAAEAKAKEGKFIENGKLVIVKNGQKFNAAGAKLY